MQHASYLGSLQGAEVGCAWALVAARHLQGASGCGQRRSEACDVVALALCCAVALTSEAHGEDRLCSQATLRGRGWTCALSTTISATTDVLVCGAGSELACAVGREHAVGERAASRRHGLDEHLAPKHGSGGGVAYRCAA